MITNRNRARTRLAEVLHSSGANADKALALVRYPEVKRVNASSVTTGTIRIRARDEIRRNVVSINNGTLQADKSISLRPESTSVQVEVDRQASGDWSVDKTLVTVDYSDGTRSGVYAGNPQSGTDIDPATVVVRSVPLPAPPNWPVPKFLQKYKKTEIENVIS